jgi:pilus assembly protein CpaE
VIGEATNGKEAIRQAEVLRPDVVLMDINMPVMDGLCASEAITLGFPSISIIMLSVQGEPEYFKRAMMAGAREFLTKPFTSDELVNTIRQAYNLEKKHKNSRTVASDYGFASSFRIQGKLS